MFDFQNSYGTDPDVLVNMWTEWKVNIGTVLATHVGLDNFATIFDGEVEQFLMLLKLLMIRHQGRSTVLKRLNFNETVDKLVVYNKVFIYFYEKKHHKLNEFVRSYTFFF